MQIFKTAVADSKKSEFRKYAQWIAIPKRFKSPKDINHFARSIGVSRNTLKKWDANPKLWLLIREYTIELIDELEP